VKLLTKAIREKLPPLDHDGGEAGGDAVVIVKFFDPCGSWTWYATEGEQDGDNFMFFGLVDGFEKELGYFTLNELKSVKGSLGLGIERDLHWTSKTLREIAPELF